jgi:hypothetical protein
MPAPGYTYLTLGQARTILANRLEDPTYVYWTTYELNDRIVEAIRAWQALTATYKQRAFLTITPGGGLAGSDFYDLNTALPSGILGYYITDYQVIAWIMAYLLEPPLTTTWTGTGQFSFSQIASAVQNRLNRFLGDTGSGTTRNVQMTGVGPSASRIFLPEGVLDVRRVTWADPTGFPYTLWRDDEYAMQAFRSYGSLTPTDPPQVWGKFVVPPVGIQVYPPPPNPGQVETLVVQAGVNIGTTPAAVVNTPVTLGIPEDFSWGLTFGALSDLLSADGPARDPARALYCEQRYQESVELYRINPVVLQAQIEGVPVWSGSVFEMDAYLASWQSQAGAPQFVGAAGHNLIAFGPIPDGTYGATLDLVSNIPVPFRGDGDFIQVDRGALDPLLDYAQHLACFKMAGAEFAATDKLRKNFYTQAALENARITKGSFYKTAMTQVMIRQDKEVPRI